MVFVMIFTVIIGEASYYRQVWGWNVIEGNSRFMLDGVGEKRRKDEASS